MPLESPPPTPGSSRLPPPLPTAFTLTPSPPPPRSYTQPSPYWQQIVLTGTRPPARSGHACARVPGAKIANMIYGGFGGKDGVLNDVWILDSNFVWNQLPSVHPSRPPALAHAAMYLDNDILVRCSSASHVTAATQDLRVT